MMPNALPGAPRLALAQPRPEVLLRRGHRRRRRPRPRHRLLPGQEPRHHQRRRPGEGLAGRRQHGPQHHDHPLELPLGRERGDLRARAEAVGGAPRGAGLRLPVQPARRAQPRALPAGRPRLRAPGRGQPPQRRRRRVARRPTRSPKVCPIVNVSDDVRYPVLGATFQPRAGIAKHDHVAWAFARACDAAGRRPHPELRGHRLRQGRRPGRRRRDHPRADHRRHASAWPPPGTAACWPSWPASGCRCSRTRCRRWSPSSTSRCTRRW